MSADLDIQIDISPLKNDIESVVTIATYNNYIVDIKDINSIGNYFSILNVELNNDLLNQEVVSEINIKFKSIITKFYGKPITDTYLTNNILFNFLENLGGRAIKVTTINNRTTPPTKRIVYNGFIRDKYSAINVKDSSSFTLSCVTKLGQLKLMSSNKSWQDTTKTYGNIFTQVTANSINFNTLVNLLFQDTVLNGVGFTEIPTSGGGKIPTTVWALIEPALDRLEVIKEILIPYSRLIYQRENGDIIVQPLFTNDYSDPLYNIDAYNNYYRNYLDAITENKAAQLNNRVDLIFGSAVPGSMFNNNLPIEIFCSAPYVRPNSNIIEPSISNELKYTDVYKTSVRLYNSGLYVLPVEQTITIDTGLLTNPILLNPLLNSVSTSGLANSIIYSSNRNTLNALPQLYAQMFLAEINANNYKAIIDYDYNIVFSGGDVIGKVVNLKNLEDIDYENMLAVSTKLKISTEGGSIYTVTYVPLLSITGVWYAK